MKEIIKLSFFLTLLGHYPSYSIDLVCPPLNTGLVNDAIKNHGWITFLGRNWTFIDLPTRGNATFVTIQKTSAVSKCPIPGERKIYYCTYSAHIKTKRGTHIIKNKPLCIDDY